MIGAFIQLNLESMSARTRPVGYVIQESGCWEWVGARDVTGYGRWGGNSTGTTLAHRAVYTLARGPIPRGLHLDHLCRNPLCVRPDHLEPVTPRENALRGIKPKITKEQVTEMRAAYAAGGSGLRAIAQRYGVSHSHLSRVMRGERGHWGGPSQGVTKPERTHCSHGHELCADNLRYRGRIKTHRVCRTCAREWDRRHRALRRAARRAA